MSRRHVRRVAAVALTAAFLAVGCEADVRTQVTPQRGNDAEVVVTVTATAELAELFREDRSTADDLVAVITEAVGERPARDDDGETITWSATTDIDAVTRSAELSGISGIDVTGDGETVVVAVTNPTKLAEALAGIEDPDGANAAAEQTRVALEVRYPGGVRSAESTDGVDGVAVHEIDGNLATWGWSVANPAEGTIIVTGNPDAPRNWAPIGVAVAAVIAAVLWWKRRRVNGAPTTPTARQGPQAPRRQS